MALTYSLLDGSVNGQSTIVADAEITSIALTVVEASHFNAVAAQRDEEPGILITKGALHRLWAIYKVALAGSEFLADTLSSAPPTGGPALTTEPSPHTFDIAHWPGDRVAAIHDLYARSLDFLLYHELAHHARDHLAYLASLGHSMTIDEQLNLANQGDGDRIQRFIEFDADHHALDMMMTELYRRQDLKTWSEEKGHTEAYLYGVSALVVFICLDAAAKTISTDYEGSHPPPLHRAARVTNEMTQFFKRELGWTDKLAVDLHDDCWIAASYLAEALGFPEGRWFGEDMAGLDLQRLHREEPGFFAFSRALDERNLAQ